MGGPTALIPGGFALLFGGAPGGGVGGAAPGVGVGIVWCPVVICGTQPW